MCSTNGYFVTWACRSRSTLPKGQSLKVSWWPSCANFDGWRKLTQYTLRLPSQWHSRTLQQKVGRLPPSTATDPRSRGLGQIAPSADVTVSRYTAFGHWTDSEHADARPGVAPTQPARVYLTTYQGPTLAWICGGNAEKAGEDANNLTGRTGSHLTGRPERTSVICTRRLGLVLEQEEKKWDSPKLQATFLEPYQVMKAWPNSTCLIEGHGKPPVQSES